MTLGEMVVAVILGLLVNEATDICPWLAIRLVRWAARLRYPHAPERAATRSEELAALINDRPGKLLKLCTAFGFALHALTVTGLRAVPRRVRWLNASVRRLNASVSRFAYDHSHSLKRAAAVALAITGTGGGVVALAVTGAGGRVVAAAGVVVGAVPVTEVLTTAVVLSLSVAVVVNGGVALGGFVGMALAVGLGLDVVGMFVGEVIGMAVAVAIGRTMDRSASGLWD